MTHQHVIKCDQCGFTAEEGKIEITTPRRFHGQVDICSCACGVAWFAAWQKEIDEKIAEVERAIALAQMKSDHQARFEKVSADQETER